MARLFSFCGLRPRYMDQSASWDAVDTVPVQPAADSVNVTSHRSACVRYPSASCLS